MIKYIEIKPNLKRKDGRICEYFREGKLHGCIDKSCSKDVSQWNFIDV